MLTMAAFPLPISKVPLTSGVSTVFPYMFNDITFDVVTIPHGSVVVKLLTTISPPTVKLSKVPTEVIFGCAGVWRVPVIILETRFEADMLEAVIEPFAPVAA